MNEFRRMMQRVLKNKWQEQWVSTTLVLLFAGLLASRALASFASVMMVIPFLFNYKQYKFDKKVLFALGLILVPVLISGLWSDDKTLWWNSLSIKLPLITLMFGLTAVTLSKEKWIQVTWIYILLISIGCCWSVWQYIINMSSIQAAYLKSKLLPTPADNDHIRFSWMVVIAILLGIKCVAQETRTMIKFVLAALIILLIIYLHLLASKTGLVCLYAGSLLYLLYIIIIQKKWKTGLLVIIITVSAAMLCYTSMPTLRNRIQYVVYDFSNYSKGNIMPGYNDAARWLSLKAGYQITTEHPLSGVGFGDMFTAIDQWHQKNHPTSFAYERFYPANEWLVYGVGSGLPGLICLAVGFFLLLYTTTQKNILSFILSAVSVIPFLIDDSLEGQYGVILLAFIAFFGQQKLTEYKIIS